MKDYYSVREFASVLGISEQAVYRWVYDGTIQYVQAKRKGAVRIPATELDRMRQQRSN